MDKEPAFHSRVAEAAKLGARKLIFSGLGSFEPDQDTAPRDGVLLEPQIRQEKTVNHVGGLEMNPHDLVDRHMQIVVELDVILCAKLAVRPRVHDFPVKLLRSDLK